ncbi:hypothetical protein A2634_03070 [Candidatus Amesbacteria bacterium RIFCSPHIGHO2_01_FULL_48_32]|uniref:Uncharacterized protein n=1 Tax=Candidatus Amesbacteria bacterium RIFCSPLOWO2_01_FULL_48_25 TaxID=1797259 RepID=A0A1F4ZB46_9BACT|nr:MAG: hypothetical protein A2634_03070 [Candidatus Amesbacteria bacterium RIFCSPHIGHO2_01_FULL_48_32]OGD03609.1 MAG: hypothetical protein A2989_02920 [Candidatus Amesbacteria bacterium RIFCSPLOWO2_01_FULL_48_25]HJZ04440.1 hypothetical protein [Patescibacteria group bacterium]
MGAEITCQRVWISRLDIAKLLRALWGQGDDKAVRAARILNQVRMVREECPLAGKNGCDPAKCPAGYIVEMGRE